LPNRKTQGYIGWLVFIGTLVSCFGCFLGFRHDLTSMRVFLIAGEVILVPLFIYFIAVRSAASRKYKLRQQRLEAKKQRELESLGSIDALLASNELGSQDTPEPDASTLDPKSPA
jgi:hypothetical protein